MSIFWQQILIGLALAAAVAYMVFYYIKRSKKKSPCSCCPTVKTLSRPRSTQSNKKSPV